MIRQAWADNAKGYEYRKLHDDLRDAGDATAVEFFDRNCPFANGPCPRFRGF